MGKFEQSNCCLYLIGPLLSSAAKIETLASPACLIGDTDAGAGKA